MAEPQRTYVTQEFLEKMKNELAQLKTKKRAEVAQRLKEAIAMGDLSENSEYDDAKNEQAFIEGHIVELENKINTAKIIDGKATKGRVSVGSKVKVLDTQYDEKMEYTIVGSSEADPFNNRISNESPVGAAILGKKKGDKVEVTTPDGPVVFEILSVK